MAKFLVHHVRFFEYVPQAVHCLAYDEDGRKVAVSRADHSIEIWSIKDHWFQEKTIPPSEGRSVEAIVWSGGRLFTAGLDGNITEYDLLSLSPKRSVPSYSGAIWCLTKNASGTHLAAGTEGGNVVLVDLQDGALTYDRPLDKQEGRILCLAWHEAEDIIVTGGIDCIRVWSTHSGHALQRLSLPRQEQNKETIVWCIAVTNDMTIISGDSRGMTLFWNGKQGTLTNSFHSHQSEVLSLCVNEEGTSVFSSGVDPTLTQFEFTSVHANSDWKQWVRSTTRNQHTLDVRAVILAGDVLVTGGVDCNLILNQLHVGEKKLRAISRIPALPHNSRVHVANKSQLVLFQYPNYLELWQLGTTRETSEVNGDILQLSKNPVKLLQLKSREEEVIVCSAISMDGGWIAYSDQNSVRMYHLNIETGQVVTPQINLSKVRHRPAGLLPAHRLTFSPDGTKLVCASNQGTVQIVTLDLVQPVLVKSFEIKQDSPSPIHLLRMSPEGQFLAVANLNKMVLVYNMEDLKFHCSLPQHETLPTAMAFAPDVSNLVVAHCDQKIIEYDLEELKYTKWSRKATKSWHPSWLKRQSKIQQILVRASNPEQLLVQDEQMLCVLDKSQPFPDHIQKSDQSETKKEEHAFHICNKYKYLLHLDELEEDWLVIVERTPMALMETLPAGLQKKKFGT